MCGVGCCCMVLIVAYMGVLFVDCCALFVVSRFCCALVVVGWCSLFDACWLLCVACHSLCVVC